MGSFCNNHRSVAKFYSYVLLYSYEIIKKFIKSPEAIPVHCFAHFFLALWLLQDSSVL
ncbi:hypothetical protein BCR41DRAFT_358770 [Lobosporangium transversale]|uniref:Uncharacterized protein n=1 Tax=Lobosporangium transversale TaxID=64571 RepID=A0A1Y2GF08_9FUNG|nr:hypothetical protein BCR41DRAFT_358770 [Lobosporangium transversale]ORZ09034.1 hypothetical protein BCR41DRAFT_358770 [Lobosporangium transversale]|eukprot:XP_021878661.1 hypothetical protein BCR41DRAFT_358770 [Lobosporangium transversale]